MASQIPLDLDTLLTRDQTALALTEAGFPVRSATLATKACHGGGPVFKLFGARQNPQAIMPGTRPAFSFLPRASGWNRRA
jgi:hypothetical protein